MPGLGFRKLTAEQEQDICARYVSGQRNGLLAEDYSVSHWTIRQTLVRHGVVRMVQGGTWRRHQDPPEEAFFSCIDTPEKAYWLGFLHADGCVTNRHNVRLVLGQLEDGPHVGCFLRSLGLRRPALVYHYPHLRKTSFNGLLCSAQMAADLYVLGISSGRRTWPRLDFDLQSSFCRGLFDGDGSWMKSRKGRIIASFVAAPAYAQDFADTVRWHTGLPATPKPYHPKVSFVRYSSDYAVGRLAQWLYSKGDIYLPRKRRRVERWVGTGEHQCPV